MTSYIFANPGQVVRLIVQTTDGYGNRNDGYIPIVNNIYFPDLSTVVGYPLPMAKLEKGLYISGLQLPIGQTALGTYIVNIYWQDTSGNSHWEVFSINVARPFGNAVVTPV